jgi:hypothetical protein
MEPMPDGRPVSSLFTRTIGTLEISFGDGTAVIDDEYGMAHHLAVAPGHPVAWVFFTRIC